MFELPLGRPAIMGVLNVTPDSFSDGGEFLAPEAAIAHGLQMQEHGADIVDIGGESTRPGASPVTEEDELSRVLPVVEALAAKGVAVSVDTSKAGVARRALDSGAVIVNDVKALSDLELRSLCADRGCSVCLMHMQGEPRTMQLDPQYEDVVVEVREFLVARAMEVEEAGVRHESIWVDPGIGFGKTLEHNLALLRHLDRLAEAGYPVLIGVSRKSFLGKLLGDVPAADRLEGTLAAQVLAQSKGARILRSHDVREAKRAAIVAQAILGGPTVH